MTTSINLDFGSKDFKIAGLESKFDFIGVPNSFVRCFEAELNRFEITVLYQLLRWHSWSNSGIVLRGVKWIYKSVAEMIEDAFRGIKSGKLYRALDKLVRLGFLQKEQLHREHFGGVHACAAYNRRNYYSPIMERVIECIFDTLTEQSPQTLSTLGFSITENEISQNETTDFPKRENITHTTSTSSPPRTPPLSPPDKKTSAREQTEQNDSLNSPDIHTKKQDSVNPSDVGQNISNSKPIPFTQVVARPPAVEQKINQRKVVQRPVLNETEVKAEIEANTVVQEFTGTDASSPQPPEINSSPQKAPLKRHKTKKGTKPHFDSGLAPWSNLEQFKKFYRALIASPYVRRMAKNLEALVNRIVNELKQGVPHPFWDDFIAGREIGSSTRQEWQMSDGSPHPDFIEYLAEKLIRGNNTQTREIAIAEALRIAKDPETARFFWKECKITLVNAKARTERDRALGVSNPVTPIWTHERVEPTIDEAAAASMEIKGINQQTTMAIEAARDPQAQLEGDAQPKLIADDPEPATSSAISSADPWLEEDKPKPKKSIRETYAELHGGMDKIPLVLQPKKVRGRQNSSSKLDLNDLDIPQINKALADPVLNADLTPQIMRSDYQIITDEFGRITGVKLPKGKE